MTCPDCGRDNRDDARFCDGCGARLDASTVRSARPYTPSFLAERILTSRRALEGERKQVTVLFADVKGSMDLAEAVDPEAWHAVLDRFFAVLCDGVHRFEGTVNQFTGDGIMALFGAPIAHEDHAQRACFAALHLVEDLRRYADELRRERGLNFSVRMGLNSGEVVVGRIGDDLRMDYTAQGHTVGLAARVEQLAEAGTVYLTEETAQLVSGYFRLQDLGAFQVKGVREPQRIYRLEGVGTVRSRLERSRARGFSRFVGRNDELARLEAALESAAAGNGQVVGVVAEPGVGKSRLCREFLERCGQLGIRSHGGHAVAHGKSIPLLPVLEMLRDYFGVGERDSDQEAREKIAGRLLLLDPSFGDALPLLFEFLGIPDRDRPAPRIDPEAKQRQLFETIKRMMQARSRREPAVIFFEDLHWIDEASEAYLRTLIDALPGTRTLFLLNFRPEYHAPWREVPWHHELALEPLGADAVEELLDDLLGADSSLAALRRRLRERAAGNPFFLEELVQTLVETGSLQGRRGAWRLVRPIEEISIPATVHAVLAARIDRLADREKTVLETAAVIGKEFSAAVLRRVSGFSVAELAASLTHLTEAELVDEAGTDAEPGFAFRHPLIQEVAYRSQLSDRRRRIHAVVAGAIEELYPDKLDERAALLATHWEGAGEPLEAARWCFRAAGWAERSDARQALRHWRKLRALVEDLPETAETRRLGLAARANLLTMGWHFGISEEEAAAIFEEGRRIAERVEEKSLVASFYTAYGAARNFLGDVPGALEVCLEATRLADESGDPGARAVARVGLVYALFTGGRTREALDRVEQGLGITQGDFQVGLELMGQSPYLYLLWFRGMIFGNLGRFSESRRDIDRAMELARTHGDLDIVASTHTSSALLARYRGDAAAALDHARRSLEIGKRMGSPVSVVYGYWALAHAHAAASEWEDASHAFERGIAIARERRTALGEEALFLSDLAEARLGAGDGEGALAAAAEALAIAHRRRTRLFCAPALLMRARTLRRRAEEAPESNEIRAALDEAPAIALETEAVRYECLIRLELAALDEAEGDGVRAARERQEAVRLANEMGLVLPGGIEEEEEAALAGS